MCRQTFWSTLVFRDPKKIENHWSSGIILTINHTTYELCKIRPLDGMSNVTQLKLIFSLYPPSCCLDIYGTLYFSIYLCGESLWLSPPPRFIYYYALKIVGFVFIIIIWITIILTACWARTYSFELLIFKILNHKVECLCQRKFFDKKVCFELHQSQIWSNTANIKAKFEFIIIVEFSIRFELNSKLVRLNNGWLSYCPSWCLKTSVQL